MRSTTASRRPSASFVLAIVALFVALGGTSYAAVTLNGKEIQKNSIPANRIKANVLGTAQINENKLGVVPQASHATSADTAVNATNADNAANATNAVNATNATNATSAQNSQTLQGRDATKFLANSVRVVSNQVTVATGGGNTITASCNANEKGIGGGGAWMLPASESVTELDAQLTASLPVPTTGGTDNMTGWRTAGRNQTGANRVLRAYVVCVPKTA